MHPAASIENNVKKKKNNYNGKPEELSRQVFCGEIDF